MNNYQKRAETVERWIRSCETQEQIDLCKEAVGVFVVVRPGESVDDLNKKVWENHLAGLISEMEKHVTQK